jgi:hypothetical protein
VSVFRVQARWIGSDAWVSSYQTTGGSLSGTSTTGALERCVPSACELSMIRTLQDQLKNVQQELKEVTTLVAVSR